MKKIIATTTINPPTEALLKYAAMPDWHVIVSGDLKTPHELYEDIDNVTYLTPEYQEKEYPMLSKLIGWRCIQRRNFAILEAYRQGADIIAIIDDDNIPYEGWGEDLMVDKPTEVNLFDINDIAFDPIGALNEHKELWHRGFPMERVPFRDYSNKSKASITPKVQAVFWNGEPDVDAVCRMIYNPFCDFSADQFPISGNKPAPFNSQNTIISRSVVRDYFLFPHIGRMDDIWAAYYIQSKGNKVVFSKPGVLSDRSLGTAGRYSMVEDMKREYIGMENNMELLADLAEDPNSIKRYLPERSIEAFEEWQNIIDKLN
jgi:hypothetical protein